MLSVTLNKKKVLLTLFVILIFIIIYLFISSKTTYHTYLLNLDRNPERMKLVRTRLEREGLEFERFSGVDGYLVSFIIENQNLLVHGKDIAQNLTFFFRPNLKMKVICEGFESASFNFNSNANIIGDYMYPYPTYIGEVGCFYSHRAMWVDMLQHDYDFAIILEDDVDPLPGFAKNVIKMLDDIPDDADIVYINFADMDKIIPSMRRVEGAKTIARPSNDTLCLTTHAYIITRFGAQKLLALTECMGMPIDVMLCFLCLNGSIKRYASNRVLCKADEKLESEISRMGRRLGLKPSLDLFRVNRRNVGDSIIISR